MNAGFYGVHQGECTLIPDVVKLLQPVKVQQIDVVVLESHQDTCRVGDGVIRFLHDHVLQLAHQVAFLGFLGITCYHAPDNDIRVEIVAHHVRREIIVDTPVIHQHAVHFDRLEHEWEAHGGAHSIAQISLP